MAFAAMLLGDLAVDLVADIPGSLRLLDDLEQIAGIPRVALGREVLRGSTLSKLPADLALQVQLSLLLIFTGTASISLWTRRVGEQVRMLGQAGDPGAGAGRVEATANQLLYAGGGGRPVAGDGWMARPLDRGQLPGAALVAFWGNADAQPEVLLEAAAPQIAAILDRTELLAAGGGDGPPLIEALERRIARLRYDLHDGPQQDVHLLAQDLRLFRDQLTGALKGNRYADRLTGRLDDLEAQLVALDSQLRQISTSMQSPFLPVGTLPEAIEEVAAAFASRSSIVPEIKLSGSFGHLSDSQQITLLALIREALSNVQKHSEATNVTITVTAQSGGVEAQIIDNGRGFDPEKTLVAAAREGHLGLVGIHERVRMLGGSAQIESSPGGPTVISAMIPSWTPAEPARDASGQR